MERGKINKPTALLCGDIHLREDVPVCRTDNYEERQWLKLDFISDLQNQYDIPVWCSGDLYHHWKPSPYLLAKTIKHLPKKFCTVLGNHDLPQHALQLLDKCGVNVLAQAGILAILNGFHFGQELDVAKPTLHLQAAHGLFWERKIFVWHIMNYQGKKPWPDCTDPTASSLIKKYPWADLLLTGDNHKTFVEEYEGRLLVNPGSMMRMTADQVDHKPCVFLWYAESNTVQQVFLPIEEGVISRAHLDVKEERNERIDAFISKLSGDYKTELSFEANLSQFFQTNKIKSSVKNIIYKSIEA